ncbi:hypothetical protein M2146_002148 [Lachnospiraceae bacterium PF1-22]|uniref:COG1361 S-layer family protein n=1 Tax=Ohessyouella blattaphilus TaxID=2949333 RepID=UPI003E30455C
MNKVRKMVAGVLAMALIGGILMMVPARAAGELSLNVKDNVVPTYTAGEKKKIILEVKNNSGADLENVIVSPDLGNDGNSWPFTTDSQRYEQKIDFLAAGASSEVAFEMTGKKAIETKRYNVKFNVLADGVAPITENVYVKGEKKAEEEPDTPNPAPSPEAPMVANSEPIYSGGGGGESGGNSSVPRVIVMGFSTDPGTVKAGSNFKLVVHLKNTSKVTGVSNMLFNMSATPEGEEETAAPSFLPATGSSSIFLEGIPAGGTADISIDLNAKADLVNKPYSLTMAMMYEDGSGNQIEGNSNLSIPVSQDARFEFSEFEIAPESVAVGDDANIMCELYNMGRIKLYNVKATFEGKGIEKEEVFIGHVESGATASIDAMLKGKQETKGKEKMKMTLSYEDEGGKRTEVSKDFSLEITAGATDEMMAEPMVTEQKKSGLPIIPVVIGVLVICGGAFIILKIKKRKSKLGQTDEEELFDATYGPSED